VAKDLRDLLGGQFKEAKFTGTFKEFVDGKALRKIKFRQYSTWQKDRSGADSWPYVLV